MSHQEATSVVPFSLDVVRERLRDVESWPLFIEGLERATKTGHNRYLLVVRSGRTTREVNAAVSEHPRENRFSWKSLGGPAYDGDLRLSVADEGRTRITLRFTAAPVGFLSGLAEMFGTLSNNDIAQVDLRRLEEHLGH
jgi:hypothetical protein